MALVCTWMGDRSGMSISVDSPSDETLNRGPLALLLLQQYEFPFGINIVQFSIFNPQEREEKKTNINFCLIIAETAMQVSLLY